jgi:hypothetical protein
MHHIDIKKHMQEPIREIVQVCDLKAKTKE